MKFVVRGSSFVARRSWFVICLLTAGFLFFTNHESRITNHELFAQDKPTSGELIVKSWEAHGRRDVETAFKYTRQCIDLYKDEALYQQAGLEALPQGKEEIEAVRELNDVATAYFIQAEAHMRQQEMAEARAIFELIIERYPCAQAWDQRGWYWQVADAARKSLKKIGAGTVETPKDTGEGPQVSQIPTEIQLYDPGKESFVNYDKYGRFENVGTKDYRYVIEDQAGLIAAVGEGVYPNSSSIRWDPQLKKAMAEGRLEGSHWDFVHSPDLQAGFLKWATASEPQGVKLFYTGFILERSGLIRQAIKCYYAIIVHFPGSYGWTYWHTPWYVGQAAFAKINFLLQSNPNLGYRLEDTDIKVLNGYDNNLANDEVITNPGRFVKAGFLDKFKTKQAGAESLKIRRRIGEGRVSLVQYENGHWQLMAGGKPYVLRGVTYAPTKVGQSPDDGTLGNWMEGDYNQNGKIDGPYDAFVDRNRNNRQDRDEPAVGDFQLMQEMGINTIRLYHHPAKADKEILRDLYNRYGIRVIMGDFLGKYTLGSGAPWNPGTDYTNEEHKKNMMQSVTNMVLEFKDEPFVLFWLLGNENVYGYACNADTDPDAFFSFANEAARYIKTIDPDHLVAISNGDVLFLDKFGQHCPDIDIFGTNAYRGNYGFGRLWKSVRDVSDKAVFISEFGCPAYSDGFSSEEAEQLQAEYHQGSWMDIQNNMAFNSGAGNAIGGIVFEWLDEWWKAYEPSIHDTKGLWTGPFPDGYMHEEWLGLCGQGDDGSLSPFLRQLRKSYYMYKKLWR